MRGAQFSATLNSKKVLWLLTVENRPLQGHPLLEKGPRSLGSLLPHFVSYSTFGGGLTERARKLQKPVIQDVIFETLSLIMFLPPFLKV